MPKQKIKEFLLRLPMNVHEAATRIAQEKRISLNKLISDVMAEYTGESLNEDVIEDFRRRIEALENEMKELKKGKKP